MDLTKCNGRRFRCKIEGTPVEGKIRVENDKVYLCQNKCNGDSAKDKLGYVCSWHVTDGLERNGVTDFQLVPVTAEEIEAYKDWQVGDVIEDDEGHRVIIIFRSGELVVYKQPGSAAGPNFTCDELWNGGFRLVVEPAPEEEIIEVTMDEIASKLGVPVERLHIKKE